MFSRLFSISKLFFHYDKKHYKNTIFQYSNLLETFNNLKHSVNKIQSNTTSEKNSFKHLYDKDLETIKNDLNMIKYDIDHCDKNYTLIYLDIEKCKKKCDTLKLNLLSFTFK